MPPKSTTAAKSYAIELGQARCREIIQECLLSVDRNGQSQIVNDPVTGCTLYTGRLTGDGYWQIQRAPRYYTRPSARSGANQHRAYYVHRIAYVAAHGRDVVHSASHLCGNGNCINAAHIHDEPMDVNVARINCLGVVVCRQHNNVLSVLCTHTPRCKKKPIYADACCLTISENPSAAPASSTESASASQATVSSGNWLRSSDQEFDVRMEDASSDATPVPSPSAVPSVVDPPPPQDPASPPPWESHDFGAEDPSQSSSSGSFRPQPPKPHPPPAPGPSGSSKP